MKTFTCKIQDELGIHARPAGLLVREAGKFISEVTIQKGEHTADAKRLFSIMMLSIKYGDVITVSVKGEDEKQAADALQEFMALNL